MREIRTSGSMSGSEKPGQGWASEALPKETGSEPIGPTYLTRRSDSTLPAGATDELWLTSHVGAIFETE